MLLLTREEEKRLLQRLEQITSLAYLRRLQDRMEQQLGIRLTIAPGPNEVRTLRGITILVHEQRGLCRKTRQSIPTAISQAPGADGLRSATNCWTKAACSADRGLTRSRGSPPRRP